uniref:Uncharacterized protein n=1 Tax=Timema monikensis TaxID=170555 RepID=A0A7R9HTA0_9NEOP|nr:unnamed protein product [Timema monikensis]
MRRVTEGCDATMPRKRSTNQRPLMDWWTKLLLRSARRSMEETLRFIESRVKNDRLSTGRRNAASNGSKESKDRKWNTRGRNPQCLALLGGHGPGSGEVFCPIKGPQLMPDEVRLDETLQTKIKEPLCEKITIKIKDEMVQVGEEDGYWRSGEEVDVGRIPRRIWMDAVKEDFQTSDWMMTKCFGHPGVVEVIPYDQDPPIPGLHLCDSHPAPHDWVCRGGEGVSEGVV